MIYLKKNRQELRWGDVVKMSQFANSLTEIDNC